MPVFLGLHRILSRGDVCVVVQKGIYSVFAFFFEFANAKATFDNKSLTIEAFLHNQGGLILCLRHCRKSYMLFMIWLRLFLIKYFCIC